MKAVIGMLASLLLLNSVACGFNDGKVGGEFLNQDFIGTYHSNQQNVRHKIIAAVVQLSRCGTGQH